MTPKELSTFESELGPVNDSVLSPTFCFFSIIILNVCGTNFVCSIVFLEWNVKGLFREKFRRVSPRNREFLINCESLVGKQSF